MRSVKNGENCNSDLMGDRGLSYGDGLFETFLVHNGSAPLLSYHLERMRRGCQVLRIDPVCMKRVESDIQCRLPEFSDGHFVFKVILSRGSGGRGYSFDSLNLRPNVWVSAMPYRPPADIKNAGIEVGICTYQLPLNPVLAGIKHLNRLDQVMCAMELEDRFEAIVCDRANRVVEGVKSNILLFKGEEIFTPEIREAGIEGVAKQFLKRESHQIGCTIKEISLQPNEVDDFSGIAFVNSVVGLVPVTRVGNRQLTINDTCRALQTFLDTRLGYLLERSD